MAQVQYKVVKANRTEWIIPPTAQPRPVLIVPNKSSATGPHFVSWICEEAAPQAATEEGQVILCDACFAAHQAGAELVESD